MKKSFLHLNDNWLCAICIETTGLDPTKHDLAEITILPLDLILKPDPKILPFYTAIKPRSKSRIDYKTATLTKSQLELAWDTGIPYVQAGELFLEWIKKFNFKWRKKISPLAYNWTFMYPFIQEWLGFENCSYCFDARYRDLLCTSLFYNDYEDFHTETISIPKSWFSYICSALHVERIRPTSTISDAAALAECYRRLLRDALIRHPVHSNWDI